MTIITIIMTAGINTTETEELPTMEGLSRSRGDNGRASVALQGAIPVPHRGQRKLVDICTGEIVQVTK